MPVSASGILAGLFEDELSQALLGLAAGASIACYLRGRRERLYGAGKPDKQLLPCYYYGMDVVCCGTFGYAFSKHPTWNADALALLLMGGLAIWMGFRVAHTVAAFCRQRPQFAIRHILVAMFVVALFCSLSRFVPAVALITAVALPAQEWAKQKAQAIALSRANPPRPQDNSPPDGEGP